MRAQATAHDPLIDELMSARRFLRAALDGVPDELWGAQLSPSYRPIGWHVGHVAAVQARWLLPGERARHPKLFDPAAIAKDARPGQLPEPPELRAFLEEVLERICYGLRAGRLAGVLGLPETFLLHHVAQHEGQHAEHIQVVAALSEGRLHRMPAPLQVRSVDRLDFLGGSAVVGCADAAIAYDNERPQHEVALLPFWLDRAPVTAGEFARFVDGGGYRVARHWTAEGWAWRMRECVEAPLQFAEQRPEAPVTCLSWYEADAYARWRGARLPTEHELETARIPSCGVWEWTSSWFVPYPGFRPYPYMGYSTPWFGTHRVLRGASWATSPDLRRPSLRNWYDPGFREIPSGFRCAGGV